MPSQKPDAAQIRAAISLLGWENNHLAKACGVTAQSISNIKRGATRPQPRVLAAIKRILEFNGIEFLDHSGVRLKSNEIEIYEGVDGFEDYTNFLYDYLKHFGGAVCINTVDESLFAKYRRDIQLHRRRMKELVDRGDVTFRILATKVEFFVNYAEYRWKPKHGTSPTAFYSFGNCLALILFEHDPSPYVVLHKSGPFAEAYRQAFDIAWNNAVPRAEGKWLTAV